jgi:hypothetical protein
MEMSVGFASRPDYLNIIERAHKEKVGENFCYHAVPYRDDHHTEIYCLGIVRKHEAGYYKISEDFFFGSETECKNKADALNRDRLSLSRREAAIIVGSSMGAQR